MPCMNIDEVAPEKTYNVLFVGSSNVGKTALALRYVSDYFVEEHEETVEDVYQTKCSNKHVIIIDTSGNNQIEGGGLRRSLLIADAYILLYSITDKESFDKLKNILVTFKNINRSRNIPSVVVGTKIDISSERQVTLRDGLALAKECNSPFFETSALNSFNVSEVFENLITQIERMEDRVSLKNKLNKQKTKIPKTVTSKLNYALYKWKHKSQPR